MININIEYLDELLALWLLFTCIDDSCISRFVFFREIWQNITMQ